MKRIIITIIVLVTVSITSAIPPSIDNFFWAGDQKVSIEFDRSIFVIVFKKGKYFKNVASTYKNILGLDKAIISGNQRITVLIFQKAQSKPENEILKNIGLTLYDLEWYSFGYTANGETTLKPTNRISFKLKKGSTKNDLEKILKGRAVFDSTYYGTPQLKVNGVNVDIVSLANEIYESGIVEYCYPDFIANIVHNDDPLYPYQYYLNNYKKTDIGGVVDADIDAPEAWDITKGSSGIKVAVIDNGVEMHDDLKDGSGNSRIVGGYTPNTGGNGAPWYNTAYHGEACAGIIAASHNNINIRGVAPNVKILTVNIFAPNTTNDEVADGINWAWNEGNADVLSNSWGYTQYGFTWPNITNAINNARTNGRNGKGSVVVFAAGNTGSFIEFPANVTGVLCVSALSKFGTITDYSSRGSRIDIAAIGGNQDIRTLDRMGSAGENSGNDMSDFEGTSAACPQVSGVAALILSVNPNLTEQQVKDFITSNATDIGTAGKDDLYGWGRLDAAKSVASVYVLVNPQYSYDEGIASLTRVNEDVQINFLTPPRPDISAGDYICDRYIVQTTVNGFAQTPLGWFITSEGYSIDDENLAVRWVNKTTTESSITLKTYFYYIKYSMLKTINKWAPFDPNLRKYGVLGIPLVPPLISELTQDPDPVCRDATTRITCVLSQGNGNLTYTWTPHNLPPGSYYTPHGSYCDVYIAPSVADAPLASIDCNVSNPAGSSFMNRTIWIDDNCTGCPTLGFQIGNELVDENTLLITSLSNPGTDVTDYYLINKPITPENGNINFVIHEPQTEHTWLDQTQLIEARVNQNEYAAVTDEGEIINYRKPLLPFTITLNDTLDVTNVLSDLDSVKYEFKQGDILKIEIKNMGSGGGDNLILGAQQSPPAKKITGILRFISNKNKDAEGKYQNFGNFFIRPNMSIICKRLGALQNGYLEILLLHDIDIDYLTIVKNLRTARTKTLNMISAVHKTYGDVKDKLLNVDQDYAEIYPGDIINFTFASTPGNQDKKAYIIKTVGRYETDTAYVMKRGNHLTNTKDENILPKENKLYDNYPNPFNPSTQIRYSIKERGMVRLKVYDALGKVVAELVNKEQPAGIYTVNFNARNLASGIYFYSIEAKDYYKVKKMILLK